MHTKDIYTDGTYLAQHPTWHAEHSPWKAKHIQHCLRHIGAYSTIAEVGCGAGEILCSLRDAMPNVQFTGFEISPQAFAMCRPGDRLAFKNEDILDSDDYFSVLLAIDVVEHIEDVFGFVRALRSHAKHAIFHFPLDMHVQGAIRGLPIKLRRAMGHLHYFDVNTALALLEECGYTILGTFYTNDADVSASPLNMLRNIGFKINPALTARFLGGISLMVTTRTT